MPVKVINGLRCEFVPRKSTSKVCLRLTFAFGSNAETTRRGLAHMVEHMFFKSNGKALQSDEKSIDVRFEKNTLSIAEGDTTHLANFYGSTYNASTSNYATSFYHEVHHTSYRVFLILLLNFFQGFRVSQEQLDTEKCAVLEEKRLGLAEPMRMLLYRACEFLFGVDESPHYTTIGTVKHLHDVDAETLNAFIAENYRMANASLLIMGNFDLDGMMQEVEALVSLLPADERPARVPDEPSSEPMPYELVRVSLVAPDKQFYYAYATRVPRQRAAYAGRVLSSILVNNENAPFRKQMFVHGALEVCAYTEDFFEGTLFVVMVCFKARPTSMSLDSFASYLKAALSEPLCVDDIELEHRNIAFENVINDNLPSATMLRAMQRLLYGTPVDASQPSVDATQAPERLRKHLLESSRGVLFCMDNESEPVSPRVCTKPAPSHAVSTFLYNVLQLEPTVYVASGFNIDMYASMSHIYVVRPAPLRLYQSQLYFPHLAKKPNALAHYLFSVGLQTIAQDEKFLETQKEYKRKNVYGSPTGVVCLRKNVKDAMPYTDVLAQIAQGEFLDGWTGTLTRCCDMMRASTSKPVARVLDEARHDILGHHTTAQAADWLSTKTAADFVALYASSGVKTLTTTTEPPLSRSSKLFQKVSAQDLGYAPKTSRASRSEMKDQQKTLNMDQPFTTIMWARLGVHRRSETVYHTYDKLLSIVAFHSLGSRLFKLREECGLFYTASGSFGAYADNDNVGLDYVLVETSKYDENTSERVLALLSPAYWTENPITQKELVWARTLLLNAYLETVSETEVLHTITMGHYVSSTFLTDIEAVTLGDLQKHALKMFTHRYHYRILIH